ncbi:MAG TPA: regulatory protein RecX [Thermomicrobiales bacterium]|nr:regulatory protein RecX [Thermomicrobiales bacterium]
MSPFRSQRDKEPKPAPKPGTITEIRPQQRDDTRVNVFIDGDFAFGLHIDLQLEHGLKKGDVLDEEAIALLLRQDEAKKAIARALNLIAYRPRAAGELATKLREKGFSPDAVEAAVARMTDLGYLDDRDFADRWVESRQSGRPRSVRMLKQELRQKGVDREIVESAVENAGIDEFGDALELARKRATSMTGLDPITRERRLGGYLARRGYGFDIIRRVLEQLESDPEP